VKSEPKNQKSSRTTRLTNCGSFGGGSASPRMSRATNSAAAPLSASRRTRSMDGCGGRNQQSNLPALLVSRVSAANKQRGKGLEYHGWRPRGGVESQSPPRLEPVAALDPCCLVYRARSRRKRRSRSSVTAVRAAGTRCLRCGACRRRDEGRNQRERGWVIFWQRAN
jgi:hypothetical protein